MRQYKRKLKRFAGMSWGEIATRSQQEIFKRWDLLKFRLGSRFNGALSGSVPGSTPRFFFSVQDLPVIEALIRERLPLEADQIVQEAHRICQHRMDLLGCEGVQYGPEIDWHLDAVNTKRAPLIPWYKLSYRFEEVGDPKVIWELNRHQHLVTLAKAYLFSKDQHFVVELLRQWNDWQEANPYPLGINWASSLEVALRSLSWLWVRHLLGACPAVPERFAGDLLRALALNSRHIQHYLSTYYAPNTHLLGEGVALFFVGTLCPQLADAERWQRQGWEIILREADRQVQADGMHFEQSTYYHVYALDFFLHARMLAARNEISIPGAFDKTIEKMMEMLLALGTGGPPPRFGDDDGGRVFDPRRNRGEHLMDPLATGAVIYKRADFKAAAGHVREETLWTLGLDGLAEFDGLAVVHPDEGSTRYEPSGICLMASPGPVRQRLIVDAGPLGAGSAGHGHADALSVHLAIGSREWLIDPGTFCYASPREDRNLYRGTAFHNTLQVDGLDQAEPAGLFAWHRLPSTRVEKWVAGETFDILKASHTGYCRLREPVVHKRCIFNLKSQYFLVTDQALGTGNHRLDLYWHFAPGVVPPSSAQDSALIWRTENAALSILPVSDHGWSQDFSEGRVSPVYGKEVTAPVLHFRSSATLPAEFAVLIQPMREEVTSPGKLVRIEADAKNQGAHAYRLNRHEDCHFIFFAESGKDWQVGPWRSDAEFMFCCIGPGQRRHWVLSGGSYAEFGGQRFISCHRAIDRLEIGFDKGNKFLYCSDESVLDYLSDQTVIAALAGSSD